MRTTWILIALLMGFHAYAEDIEFPEDELARETSLPVFSQRRIVLNRNVVTAERFEFGLGGGLEMNEPYYNTLMYGAQGTYNFNETSAVNVQTIFWAPGLSSYGNQLKQTGSNHKPFDPSLAPHPTWALIGNYEFIAYYGKISVSKQTVMNLNTFGLAGLGYMSISPLNTVVLNLGVGQNFFFTKNMGVRWDLRWLIFQGPNATSQTLTPGGTAPSAGSFSNQTYFNTQLGLSMIFLI